MIKTREKILFLLLSVLSFTSCTLNNQSSYEENFTILNPVIEPTLNVKATTLKIEIDLIAKSNYEIVKIKLELLNSSKNVINSYTFQEEELIKDTTYKYSHTVTAAEKPNFKYYRCWITEYK